MHAGGLQRGLGVVGRPETNKKKFSVARMN